MGIDATVFEKDASPTARPRDWNFGIYWALSPLESILPPELHDRLRMVQTDVTHEPNADSVMPIFNGASGELLRALETPFSIRLRRRSWLDLLRTGIDVRVCRPFSLPWMNSI